MLKHLLLFQSFFLFNDVLVGGRLIGGDSSVEEKNKFTSKASLVRYWNKEISGGSLVSEFLISKTSPLNAIESANFTNLAIKNSLPHFCSAANLFCFPDLSSKFSTPHSTFDDEKAQSFFINYHEQQAQKNNDEKVEGNTFINYGGHQVQKNDDEKVEGSTFINYGGHKAQKNDVEKVGGSTFINYGGHQAQKNNDKKVGGSTFINYGGPKAQKNDDEKARGSTFINYGGHQAQKNNDEKVGGNTFINYGGPKAQKNDDEKAKGSTFINYGGHQAQKNNDEKVEGSTFINYGGHEVQKNDDKKTEGGTFINYGGPKAQKNDNEKAGENIFGGQQTQKNDGETVNKLVEPGLFFRESKLKEGTVISLPDIKDVMPERSFLPRSIVSKLPFSVSKIGEIKEIFHAGENSMMEDIITNAVTECARPPSIGEMKQCVGAAEDMIDFATKVLGRSVVLRTTENAVGSKERVVIGKVNVINGGKITKSVSCHQRLYPYLLYYCHSVPKVRVYEVDLLESNSKTKINHGIAICHIDTSSWSPNHLAFIALGSKPGRIEVCHWMFENEMSWTVAD